jgi:2-polyprenyl-6-hydroxyphenyl methylase/3-demethylubiquinone-9 3-methyltransferase
MARLGADVVGIDASERNVMVARHHAGEAGIAIDYRHALPEDLAGEADRYDIVLSLEVVEHVADAGEFLRAIGTLTRPGGLLVVGTLNRTPLGFEAVALKGVSLHPLTFQWSVGEDVSVNYLHVLRRRR